MMPRSTVVLSDVPEIVGIDDYNSAKAKQRASVRWLVSKAYNNKVPSNLQEPYYRDQNDGSERLKPQLVHALANAELYCSCLANIYADPNYHNLSHWGIIQALARKGVYVAEPSDVALTETVLIQTGPIRISAHMAVMEAVMALYIREVITAERVVGVVRRFSSLQASTELPVDQEEALLLWINKSCATLQAQASAECRANQELRRLAEQLQEGGVPTFPLLQDLSDLSDGTCLAGLISLYCPDELSWPQIALSEPPRIADSLYNLQLVEKFCSEALPYNTFFLSLEDILYMHSSVKQNFLVLLSDLFYLFEISPAKCVRTPSSVKDRVIELRRQNSLNSSGSPRRSQPELRSPSNSQQDSFSGGVSARSEPPIVVRRARNSRAASDNRGRQRYSMYEGCDGGAAWTSVYPDWWWRCSHPPTEPCHYCSRPGNTPFHQQCYHHVAAAGTTATGDYVSSANNPYNGGVVGDHRRPLSVYQPNDATSYRDDDRSNSADSDFVVQRAQGPMTLSRMVQHRRPQQPPGQLQQQRSLSPGSVHSDELVPPRPPRRHRQSASQAQSECGDDRLDDRQHFAFTQQQPSPAAGRPTVGRLSRRGSFSEDSQLTVENFGGSQDNMHMLGRNPDKQPVVHQGRRPTRDSSQHRDLLKESNISFGDRDPFQEAERDRAAAMSRSVSRQDLYDPAEQFQQQPVRPPSRNLFHESSIKAHFGGDDSTPQTRAARSASAVSSEMEAFEREAVRRVESHAKNGSANNNLVIMLDANDDGVEEGGQQPLNHQQQQQYQKPTSSFAQLSASKNGAAGINVVYMQGGNGSQGNPSTRATSWGQQQQSRNRLQEQPQRLTNGAAEEAGDTMASEMHNIKLRLEEKRRSIESEKRRLEGAMEQHKQSMGKQAFLQAIGQGKCLSSAGPVDKTAAASASASGSISGSGSGTRTSDSVASQPSPEEATEEDGQMMADSMEMQHPPRSQRSHLTLQDVGQNMNQLQSKWSRIPEPINSPDLDNMDYDQYQNSLQTMNESLTELQDDIQRLSQQQSQVQHMQHMMHNGGPHSPSQAPPPLSHHQPPYHHLPPQQQQHHYQSPAGLYGPPAAHPQQTSQFFLHDQQPHPGAAGHRRQWGQPMAPEDIYQQMSSPGRARWAQPVRQPIMPQQQPPNPYGAPPHQSPYYDSPGNYQHHPPPLHHHQQQPQHLPHLQDPSAGYHQGYQHPQHMGGMMPGHTLPQPPPSTTSAMSRYPDYGGGMGGVYGGGELVRPSPVAADSNGVGGFRLHEPGSSAGLLPERVYSGSEYRQPVTRPPQRRQQSPVLHAPLPAPSLDDMEPQSVSFIGGEREEDASEVARQRLAALAVNDDADASPGNRTFRVHRGSSDNLPADSARRRPLVTSRTYKVPRRTPSPGNGVDSPAWAGPGRGASQSPPRYEPASRQSPPKLSQDAVTSRRFSGATRSQSPAKRDHCTPDRQLSSRGDQHQLPQDQEEDEISHEVLAAMKVDKISADANPDLGFVISFESDAAPRKPKPKLGARRGVSKASSNTSVDSADRRPPPPMTSTPQQPPISSGKAASAFSTYTRRSGAGIDGGIEGADQPLSLRGLSSRIGEDRQDAADKFEVDESVPLEEMRPLRQERGDSTLAPMGVGLVIGDQLASPKSETLDEMDRKKERILMMSLKRKEQSEAARRKKEEDTLRRKEEEARKEEEKLRKKEEDKERKERIFEQYKLKKAIEEAEKNGTAPPPMPAGRPAAAGGPPVRSRARPPSAGGRPARPRSVVERGAADPAVTPSRGVHGSSSNLAAMSECDSAARPPVAPPPAPSSAVSLARHRSLSRHRHSHIAVTARSSSLTNSAGRHNNENNANRTPADKARSSGGGAGSRWGSNTSLSGGGSRSRRGSNSSLYGTESRYGRPVASHSGRKTDNDASTPGGGMSKDGGHRTSTGSLSGPRRSRSRLGSRTNSSNSLYDDPDAGYRSSQFAHSGRRVSAVGGAARGALSKSRPDINRTFSKGSLGATAPAHKSLANLFGGGSGIPRYSETDSGLGRDTPTRRGVSPGVFARPSRRLTSPSGPGSLPPGLVSRRRNLGDDASDVSSVASYDYNGPRLFKQPASKSNRSMMLNAVEYCVFPGAVNREAKHRVLEEIASCEAKHFLILFRDARCQFRALYWYEPETEEVVKLYGTGPKQASDNMFDRFFKYNSGGKCFSQIHTKHLSATIDAFTIHDALWQGKRPSLPSKRDMKLVT